MELSTGTWVHEPWTWFVLLDIVLKETQAASGLVRMVWRKSWGIHISTVLLPLARAVCHILVPNQQHKPNLSFPQDDIPNLSCPMYCDSLPPGPDSTWQKAQLCSWTPTDPQWSWQRAWAHFFSQNFWWTDAEETWNTRKQYSKCDQLIQSWL